MAKIIHTGGPAFPTPAHNLQNDGMTLRDYFAAKAMQALLSHPDGDHGPSTMFHVFRKPTDEQIKNTEQMFGWKWKDLA